MSFDTLLMSISGHPFASSHRLGMLVQVAERLGRAALRSDMASREPARSVLNSVRVEFLSS